MGQNRFKKFQNSKHFNYVIWSNFDLVKRGKNEQCTAYYGLLNRITAKNENNGQTCLKKHLNYTVSVKYCVMTISRNNNRFLMGIERSLSKKGIMKV